MATATTTAAPPPPAATTATWEDLYIIPSSFDDDDHGDEEGGEQEGGSSAATTTATTTTRPPRVLAWPNAGPIVILPGFGNDTEDYESPFGDARRGLAPRLRRRGFVVETVRLRRRDWLRVARALGSPAYWRGQADVAPGYYWYLLRVAAAVRRAEKKWMEANNEGENKEEKPRVVLVAHSAGGWLGRAFLGDAALRAAGVAEAAQREEDRAVAALGRATGLGGVREALATAVEVLFSSPSSGRAAEEQATPLPSAPRPCVEEPHPSVAALVTLGTPHLPPAPGSGARDVTGGALAWVNEQWPGAFFGRRRRGGGGAAEEEEEQQRRRPSPVVYVTVAGRAVRGAPAEQSSDSSSGSPTAPRGSAPSYAREAYKAVAGGQGAGVVGDAVVPLHVASSSEEDGGVGLPGADASVVLDGVWHSMSRLGSFKEPPPSASGAAAGDKRGRDEGRAGGSRRGVRPWYGSGGAIDQWLAALKEEPTRRS